jgi:predicted nucleic acid-binding protein
MKLFFDTSVLVAASVRTHEHHASAFAALQSVQDGQHEGFAAGHTLAEIYAVLTKLPVTPRIRPTEAAKIVEENIVKHVKIEILTTREYAALVRNVAEHGFAGGAVYDALLLACAEKTDPERIFTFNVGNFKRLAPHLEKIIVAP